MLISLEKDGIRVSKDFETVRRGAFEKGVEKRKVIRESQMVAVTCKKKYQMKEKSL